MDLYIEHALERTVRIAFSGQELGKSPVCSEADCTLMALSMPGLMKAAFQGAFSKESPRAHDETEMLKPLHGLTADEIHARAEEVRRDIATAKAKERVKAQALKKDQNAILQKAVEAPAREPIQPAHPQAEPSVVPPAAPEKKETEWVVAPTIRDNIVKLARAEVDVEHLDKEIATIRTNVDGEKKALLTLRESLRTGEYRLAGHTRVAYTEDEVKADLARRYDSIKNVKKNLDAKEAALKAKHSEIVAFRKQLETMMAQKALARLGDVEVKVVSAKVAPVALSGPTGEGQSKEPQLILTLEVSNTNQNRKIDYRTWAGADMSFERRLRHAQGQLREHLQANWVRDL